MASNDLEWVRELAERRRQDPDYLLTCIRVGAARLRADMEHFVDVVNTWDGLQETFATVGQDLRSAAADLAVYADFAAP